MSVADRRTARPLSAKLLARRFWRLVIALAGVVIAALIPYSFPTPLGFAESFVLFAPIILLVGMFDGFWLGISFTLVSTLVARYLFLAPRHAIAPSGMQGITGVLPFVLLGIGMSFVGDLLRRRTQRLKEFEKAVQGSQEMIVVVSRDYRYLIANDAFLEYRGMKREEVIGHHLRQVLSPGVFESSVKGKLDECFAGKTVQYQLRYEYPVRGERDLLISYFPIEGERGIDRVACVSQDMTDLKQSEQDLRLFRRLIDSSNDSVLVIDPGTYCILDVNEKTCHDLGYTHAELVSMKGPDICATVHEGEFQQMLENLKLGQPVLVSGLYKRKDGSTYPVEASLKYVELDRSYVIAVSRDVSERFKAEQALRRREEDYRLFVAQSSEGIFREELDAPLPIDLPEDELIQRILDGSYIAECNDAMARMYGFTSGTELLGKRITAMLLPGDPRNVEMTQEYVRSGFRVLDRESHEVDVHGNRKIFRNSLIGIIENGSLVRTWGIQRDVTEQVRLEKARTAAEAALRKSEEHFRLLVEQASDGIFLADSQGRYVDVNTAGAQMLGYTRQEILNLSICDVTAPSDVARIASELSRFAEGATIRSEWTFRRKDGSCFPGEVSGKQLPDGRLQGILRDMSERRRAEQEMRHSEERFRVALKDSPITVFNQDQDLRYTWIYNPQLYWQFDALGKTDEEIVGARKSAKLTSLKRQVLTTGLTVRDEVTVRNEGKGFVFDMTIEPLLDSAGNVVGITGACMDIAKIRELADRLQDSRDRLQQEKSYLETEIRTELGFEHIIGESPALREVLKKARIVAPTDSTVLLLGETGTGKELVARSLHSLSTRHDQTFVKLNCAAVPSGLLESELFGHEKGAFTSAVSRKIGRIELADKGTLFLDEIGELPQELQPKLLRVLQDRDFERLGGVHTLRVDVRIISATNRDLLQDVLDKKFREDLYYRLNVFPIHLPALRERREDIAILVRHFVEKHARRMGKHIDIIPDESMRTLSNWKWPGNVRELENMVERMIILTTGNVLAAPPAGLEATADSPPDDLSEMEREHIIHVLRETNGVLSGAEGAAVRLGLKRTTLQSMLKRFGIEAGDFRRGNGAGGQN